MLTMIKTLVVLAAAATTLAQPHSLSCSSTASAQPTPSVDANTQLVRDVLSAPTAIERFQRLLVQGSSLLTGDALRKIIVFDFEGAQPASGALGGAAKAAVRNAPCTVSKVEADSDVPLVDRDLPFLSWPRHQPDCWIPRALRHQHSPCSPTR